MFSPSRGLTPHAYLVCTRYVAGVLIAALCLWTLGVPWHVRNVYALSLSDVRDVLSTSAPGMAANHTITFTTPSGIVDNGSTIVLTFASGFGLSTIGGDDIDIADDGVDLTVAESCGAAQAAVSTSTHTITISLCSGAGGAIAPDSMVTIEVGTHATADGAGAHRITNHAEPGSYELGITGSMQDSGYTRLVIMDAVRVTGAVDSFCSLRWVA